MGDDLEWETVRRQVAIAGCVRDAGQRPVVGAKVALTAVPEEFAARIRGALSAAGARWEQLEGRPDRVLTRWDGCFYFLDLPAGHYTLTVTAPRSGAQEERSVSVAWDKNGKVKAALADFRLSDARE